MLKDFGVRGVKVQELFSLDDAFLDMLPKPVYGLIFLFRYRADPLNNQEASCPEHVWFANQTHDFSCASVALLNIVNNVPSLHLGTNLQNFKEFTQPLTPAMRGDQIGAFNFVKQIHNSFARKMDMLNIDLGMQNQFDDRNKKPKKTENTPQKGKRKKNDNLDEDYGDGRKATPQKAKGRNVKITDEDYAEEEDDSGFHFIAYVPIDGEVWKLDGLDRQPEKLGSYPDEDWLSVVAPVLQTRMLEIAASEMEYNLVSLVKHPLLTYQADLAENIKSIQAVQTRLDAIKPEWRDFKEPQDDQANGEEDFIDRMNVDYGISDFDIDESMIASSTQERLSLTCPQELKKLRNRLISAQVGMRRNISDERDAIADDERRARDRRHDYGPLIRKWVGMLAEQEGLVKELVEEIR